MSAVWRRAVAFSVLIHLPYVISSSTSYQRGDTVPLYANKARYSFLFGLQKQRHEIQSHLVRWAHLQIQASSTNTTLFPFALQRFVFLSAALYERIFDLPRPVSIFQDEERKSQHLGEVLAGDRMMKTLFSLPFLGI